MGHPYSTEARLRRLAAGRGRRLDELADRNRDGAPDSDPAGGSASTVADALERAAVMIDDALGMVYEVPFADLTGSPLEPAVPGVGDVCDLLALAFLFEWHDPSSPDAAALRADAMQRLDLYRRREWALRGATPLAQTEGRLGVRYESIGTYAAGGCTSGSSTAAYTTDTTDQTRGL